MGWNSTVHGPLYDMQSSYMFTEINCEVHSSFYCTTVVCFSKMKTIPFLSGFKKNSMYVLSIPHDSGRAYFPLTNGLGLQLRDKAYVYGRGGTVSPHHHKFKTTKVVIMSYKKVTSFIIILTLCILQLYSRNGGATSMQMPEVHADGKASPAGGPN